MCLNKTLLRSHPETAGVLAFIDQTSFLTQNNSSEAHKQSCQFNGHFPREADLPGHLRRLDRIKSLVSLDTITKPCPVFIH